MNKFLIAFVTLIIGVAGFWLWCATEPEKVVGRLDVKVGPGWHQIAKLNVFGLTVRFSYVTYKLCLVDVYGQHVEVDVSKQDFNSAQFEKFGSWPVSRIRKHYQIEFN